MNIQPSIILDICELAYSGKHGHKIAEETFKYEASTPELFNYKRPEENQ